MMTEEQKQALTAFINAEKVNVPGTMKLTFHDMLRLEVYEVALAALTQPASPALKLPDVPPNALVALCEQMYDHRSTGVTVAHDVWQDCIEELRIDAPHTAPIEPVRQAFKVGDIVEQSGDIAEVLCTHSNGALDVRELKSGKHYGWSSGMCVLVERAKEG